MDELNTPLEKIVCSRETAQKLVTLGVSQAAVFHWFESESPAYSVGIVINPKPYDLPAWTYEELRIMIGNKYEGAELPVPRPNAMPGEAQRFYNYYPDRCTNHEIGAEGNAQYLLWLLEVKMVSAADVNHNYKQKYNP